MKRAYTIFATLLSGTLIAVLFACALSLAAHFVPRAPILQHVQSSIPLMSHFRRADTFTECLVIGSALLPDASIMESVFDFIILNGRPPDPHIPHDHESCASLRALVSGISAEDIGTQPYTRYWNGPVSLARFALGLAPYLYAYIFYALAGVAAFALWGWSLAKRGLRPKAAGLIAFACFYGSGLPYVIGNLAHTPAFIVPLLLLSSATLKSGWWKQPKDFVLLASCLGGLTFYFDMLFMAIPFNALMLGTSWLLLKKTDKSHAKALLPELILLLSAYAFGGAMMLGGKLVIIGLMHDPSAVLDDFFHQLFWRMSYEDVTGQSFSFGALVLENLPLAATKMFFHPLVCYVLYIAGLVLFAQALRRNAQAALPFALLAAITPVWYFIFTNHSWIHGTFAMRILFWPPLLGLVACYQSYLAKNHEVSRAR